MGHILLVAVLAAFAAADGETGQPGLPGNLNAGPFRSTVEAMWKTSPSFRDQCARIAAQRGLKVQLRAEVTLRPGSPRARTEFSRRDGVLTLADVVVSDPRDRIELIAHELEHVVEQIEGLRLRESTCAADKYLTSAHESCRAIAAGRRIAREVGGRTE